MAGLKELFFSQAGIYCKSRKTISGCWKEIEESYSAGSRYYHNFRHIESLVQHWEDHFNSLRKPEAFLFAIFYHDIVYDVKSERNEEASAERSSRRLTELNVPQAMIADCANLIMATKNHESGCESDPAWFVDFDLSILGSAEDKYDLYASDIRKEYAEFPQALYCAGRVAILERFLALPFIYHTYFGRAKWEQQARYNLIRELKWLRLSLDQP